MILCQGFDSRLHLPFDFFFACDIWCGFCQSENESLSLTCMRTLRPYCAGVRVLFSQSDRRNYDKDNISFYALPYTMCHFRFASFLFGRPFVWCASAYHISFFGDDVRYTWLDLSHRNNCAVERLDKSNGDNNNHKKWKKENRNRHRANRIRHRANAWPTAKRLPRVPLWHKFCTFFSSNGRPPPVRCASAAKHVGSFGGNY